MAITAEIAEKIEEKFMEAFHYDSYGFSSQEDPKQAYEAWNYLWSVMEQENNFTNKLGSKLIDWQIGNFANDTTMALHNGGMYKELIQVNEQILKINWLDDTDNTFHENAKRDMADAYADMGDYEKCNKLYDDYLLEDPQWGWGWIGYYRQMHDQKKDDVFQAMILGLYKEIKGGTEYRDKEDLIRELSEEFERLGDMEKSKELEDMLPKRERKYDDSVYEALDMRIAAIKPFVAEKKVYPNDPCPCGSGKKYKKCCGRKGN